LAAVVVAPRPTVHVDALVAVEEVRTLYRQGAPVLAANVVNSIIVSAVLWNVLPHAWLVAWSGAMCASSVVRWELRRRYFLAAPSALATPRWARLFVVGSAVGGVLWGLAGGLFFTHESTVAQLLIAFVLGGMGAGAAGTLSCYMPAFYAYFIPSLVPLAIRLLTYGDGVHGAMAGMTALYGVLFVFIARNVHRSVHEAFRLRFVNDELLGELAEVQHHLSESNVELERRVVERTGELEQRAQALKESQQKLADMIRESPDVILSLTKEGIVVACSPAVERILGYSPQDIVGRSYRELPIIPKESATMLTEAFERVLNESNGPPLEIELIHRDGSRVAAELNARLARGDGQHSVEATLRDVTERKRLEHKLRTAQRLESIGRLAGGVAHDFNNLLTVSLSNLSVALADQAMSPPAREAIDEARQASRRAAELTQQLLAFGRRQMLAPRAVDLNEVILGLRKLLERLLDRSIQLRFDLDPKGAPVKVDPTQLERVVINLATNAREAMPRGGVLTVRTARAVASSEVVLTVTDDGIGMDEATRAQIFEPFFTASRGTGLGLSTVHGIVEQSGGTIVVQSTPGKGTRFDIHLPLTDEMPTPRELATTTPVPPRTTPATVLLVEDEDLVRRATARVLRRSGYQVLMANDGQHALELAAAHSGTIDLLLSDVVMPILSGPALAARMLAERPKLRVLLVSGYSSDAVLDPDAPDPRISFLGKPYDDAKLAEAVASVLDRREPVAR
jgi:two-component system, cell cycle sensor histidine kinase and response regulator CckA